MLAYLRSLRTLIPCGQYHKNDYVKQAEKTLTMISELAKVVRQEKALLQEFLELLRIISTLEVNEDA